MQTFRQHVIATFILLWCYSTTLLALDLTPHTATYTAKIKKGNSINGEAVRELRQLKNGQWLYRFDVDSMAATIKESLILEWDTIRVHPIKYDYELSGFFIKDRNRSINFDRKSNTASGSHKKQNWKITTPENVLDRLGYQLQLLIDISSGSKEVNYQIAHKGRIEPSLFRVLREEEVSTAIGHVNSVLIEKVRDKDNKRKTLLWFSKAQPLLLLKMSQIEKDGEHYEINVKHISYPK